ncbi:MAG: hypothetical protein KF716_18150 [Anaerolineae bacterium]|nr:hypothetical protein [Anaerolineae bacterium]
MTQLVLTAYDINTYLSEALTALKAAIYRSNLSPAKDVLATYNETLVDEWNLNEILPDSDYRWIFTDECADLEHLDPEGDLVGLTYPLILLYHHPDVLRMNIPGGDVDDGLPFPANFDTGLPGLPGTGGLVQSGYTEGLRTMWEIVGYLTPDGVQQLQQICLNALVTPAAPSNWLRAIHRLTQGLNGVIQQGYGLVIERE